MMHNHKFSACPSCSTRLCSCQFVNTLSKDKKETQTKCPYCGYIISTTSNSVYPSSDPTSRGTTSIKKVEGVQYEQVDEETIKRVKNELKQLNRLIEEYYPGENKTFTTISHSGREFFIEELKHRRQRTRG